jgi:HKD family nuclease
VILQDAEHPGLVLAALVRLLSDPTIERLRVAVAYANEAGVDTLLRVMDAAPDGVQVEMVVTLDMGITRKAALVCLLHEFGDRVRTVSTPGRAGTFHAKAFVVDRNGGTLRALVGSANLTAAALTNNREALALIDLRDEKAQVWEEWWGDLMEASEPLTQDTIDNYTERKPPPGRRERIADEDVETRHDGSIVIHPGTRVDAEAANYLAIDWGGTGEYRVQAEFPKSAAAFFRPELDHERAVTLHYGGIDYTGNQLRYYPDNGMARINLDNDLPPVADDSIRSAASLFIRRGPDNYELRLLSEPDRARRLAEADLTGGRDHTRRSDGSWREFGWA